MWMLLEYQFPLDISYPSHFQKNLRDTAYVELINFEDPIHKVCFDIYHIQIILNFPKKAAENQHRCKGSQIISLLDYYLRSQIRILDLRQPDVNSSIPYLKKSENYYVQLINFEDPFTRVILILTCTDNLEFSTKANKEPIHMWRILDYKFPVRHWFPLPSSEKFDNYYLVKLINFQVPIQKSDFNTYYARRVFDLSEKLVKTNIWMFLSQNIS